MAKSILIPAPIVDRTERCEATVWGSHKWEPATVHALVFNRRRDGDHWRYIVRLDRDPKKDLRCWSDEDLETCFFPLARVRKLRA